ncbi:hypothetical protein BJ170DRAFT_44160 [Xylariales sp. AK1849]|nr:hypothetical protein BJ170DRAFT_44160 [Xylariales sp. AK1849]
MPRLKSLALETGTPTPSNIQVTAAPLLTSAPLLQHVGTEDFVLGLDTCGFTSGDAITCSNPSNYCMNIGDYRGCCSGSADDCTSTIWTTCKEVAHGAGYCGEHNLCCSDALPHCMTHYFTTDATPGNTFTNVACGTAAAFGQLYPYPPELMPTTSDMQHSRSVNATGSVTGGSAPGDGKTDGETVSIGAIVGALCGAILLVGLVILAFYLAARRRRRRAAPTFVGPMGRRSDVSEPMPEAERRRRRLRLSTIPEQLSPSSPTSASPGLVRCKSARRSHGPDWPLGSADPLESHPPDLEKQLSEPRRGSVPLLQLPTLPTGRLSPAPGSSPESPGLGIKSSTSRSPDIPNSRTVMLQSPRLSYHPISPIDAAFDDEVERRVGAIDGAAASQIAQTQTQTRRASSADEVSPIDENDHLPADKRFSFVSMPSLPDDRPGDFDELVSPIWPDDPSLDGDGRMSPALTVSPIDSSVESRRGSVE